MPSIGYWAFSVSAEAGSPTCLVTGAAGGIGQHLVRVFVDAGYLVVAMDVVAPEPGGLDAHAFVARDVARLASEEDYADATLDELRKAIGSDSLDVLVNNAAVQRLARSSDLTRRDWTETLQTNLLAPFFLTQALLPELELAGGCVINMSSIHARLTKRGFVAYATSKAALSALTRNLAVDLEGSRVRVNALEPAAIDTPMLREGFRDAPDAFADLAAAHPRGRVGDPGEVARLALAIASGDFGFLHGACIGIDGGILGRLHDPV